jgi:hypothetical protein
MPRSFSNGGYSVTINDDRSIRVRSGDWISKYSAAIYGDPMVHWDRFKRKNSAGQFINLADPNKITAGELLYHPAPLPGEPNDGTPENPIGVPEEPENPDLGGKLDPRCLLDFIHYLKQWLCPVNDWEFKGSSGADLSAGLFSGHLCILDAKHRSAQSPTRFVGVAGGVGIGPEDFFGSIAISPSDFWGRGFIGKFPTAGRTLSVDEICGSYMVIDASAGLFLGGSAALLLFGMNDPVHAVLRTAYRYFGQGGGKSIAWPWVFTGAAVMLGTNWCSPNLGASIKVGAMHRRECLPV